MVLSWMQYLQQAQAGGVQLVRNSFAGDKSLLAWAPQYVPRSTPPRSTPPPLAEGWRLLASLGGIDPVEELHQLNQSEPVHHNSSPRSRVPPPTEVGGVKEGSPITNTSSPQRPPARPMLLETVPLPRRPPPV